LLVKIKSLHLHRWISRQRTGAVPGTFFFVMEYRLMYMFGAWVTAERIFAESDAEAIFDADAVMATGRLRNLRVALFCGNRKVKAY
jgi:hypothetical protein